MPFGHKLAHRLALLKARLHRGALLALALSFVASCEKPISISGLKSTVTQLVVSPSTATLQPNQVQDFMAVGYTAAGDTAQIAVAWSASGGTVDTNSAGGRHYGHYHNGSCGQYTLTATSTPGNLTAGATITVACAAPVATVTISPPAINLQISQTSQLTVTLKDANGNVLTGRTVTWSSDNGSVATVSGTGLVTAAGPGTANITAMSEGKSGTASVTVSNIPVASVTVSPTTANLTVGQTVQLTATPKDANGNGLTGRPVTWTSSDGTIASVNGSGLVTGVAAAGPVTITATSEGHSGTASINVTSPGASVVLVGAGDIADCDAEPTAALLDNIPGTVFTAGDNAYPNGSSSDYSNCYDPSWGRHKARTRPSPGNHDYQTSGATGYYKYFGAAAGPAGQGYYSYDLGAWHIVSLNSNVSMSAGSAQETWLRADLAASTKRCTIAYWHHPRFSSGSNHGSSTQSAGVWQALYDAGAEIVISGHDHEYERFAPQTPSGAADPTGGIREFVVGTGGAGLYSFATPLPNSEVRDDATFGVLKLTLSDGSYAWEFIPIAGDTFTDSGSGTCH